jgi:hypothetical protein
METVLVTKFESNALHKKQDLASGFLQSNFFLDFLFYTRLIKTLINVKNLKYLK